MRTPSLSAAKTVRRRMNAAAEALLDAPTTRRRLQHLYAACMARLLELGLEAKRCVPSPVCYKTRQAFSLRLATELHDPASGLDVALTVALELERDAARIGASVLSCECGTWRADSARQETLARWECLTSPEKPSLLDDASSTERCAEHFEASWEAACDAEAAGRFEQWAETLAQHLGDSLRH